VLDVEEGGARRGRNPPRKLPPPEPDHVPYKWKGDQYLGYDWRSAEANPLIRENYERHQRTLAKIRAARAERVKRNPPKSRAGGSMLFRGWRWLCPACQRPVKVVFYPLPAVSKLHCDLTYYSDGLPKWFVEQALAAIEAERAAPRQFACNACNRVGRTSRVCDNMWNDVISCLSRGLLYGHEVKRPACVTADRKVAFVTHRRLPSPANVRRRERVCARLIKGWSYRQIAESLGISYYAVCGDAQALFKRHGVNGRGELAQKRGAPLEPLMSKWAQVCAGVTAGKSNAQIARESGINKGMVATYAYKYRRAHGVAIGVGTRSRSAAACPTGRSSC
jgi:DNA-binding CsgD family transcriptional regulator